MGRRRGPASAGDVPLPVAAHTPPLFSKPRPKTACLVVSLGIYVVSREYLNSGRRGRGVVVRFRGAQEGMMEQVEL